MNNANFVKGKQETETTFIALKTIDFKSLSFVTTYISVHFGNRWEAVPNSVSVQALFTQNLLFLPA